jgi:hypothetical protein
VVTTGPGNDASFGGFGSITNVTSLSFERDLRVVLLRARINPFGYAIYTKHPQWNFGFTIGDSINVTGFASAAFNGTFIVAGFLSTEEVFCLNAAPTTATQIFAFERNAGNAIYDTSTPHGFVGGETVLIEVLSNPAFNGTFVVNGYPTPTQFTCANAGTNLPVTPSVGYVYTLVNENARAWAYPNVALTPQTKAGVNSLYTVAGINHVGENALIQNNQFYDFGVGIADAETFIVKSFLPMNVDNLTVGARVLNNDFSYQGRNSIQSTLYPGSAESNTQCVVGGFSSLTNPINVVSRVGGVATYTCVMKHTLRVGDVVVVNSFSNPTFNGSLTVISTPDAFRFTASTGGPDVLPGLYLDGQVIMLRSQRIFASECQFKYNRVQGGPNPVDQQSPVTAITVRETSGADISYNNFDGFRGTCFYVDSYQHKGTHIHNNSALNISAFIALVVQDWFTLISGVPTITNPEAYSTLISGHKDMLIENNDVLLTGPGSWFYQTAYTPLDAVFLVNNHDVNKSTWYYPTDYQIPIRPLAPPAPFPTGASRDAAGISTFTTVSPHELQVGMEISMVSVADGTFNGVFTVLSTPSLTQFTVNNPVGPIPNTPVTSGSGFLGINSPVHFPWEIKPIGFQRTAGVATYTTNKAHQILLGYHVTVEGLSNASFNDQTIVTGTPTTTTFTCASPGPDVPFTSETGNFFRYVDNIQIGCNNVRRLSGQGLVRNNGGQFGNAFLTGRPNRCVAPLEQFFYFDCPEGCLALECDPGPCKPNDYLYRI